MMQEASGEGHDRQEVAPPASPEKTHAHLALNNILYLPSENPASKPFSLDPYLKGYPVNLPYVLSRYLAYDGHDSSNLTTIARYRQRLSRRLKELKSSGLIDYWRGQDGLCQWLLTSNGLNLIRRSQNSNSEDSAPIGPYALPRKATPGRLRSLRLTMRNPMINGENRGEIDRHFIEYLDDIQDKKVILTYKSEEKNPDAPLLFLPYRTRFTSMERKKGNLATYEGIWKQCTLSYRVACMVTLTTDPKLFPSAYHANKHFQIALNRFFSYLTKKREKRPKYLNVHEFTKNGLLHAHIVLWNIDYLMHFKRLSEVWQKCGQGRIVHIYGLQCNGTTWNWKHAQPENNKDKKKPIDYLKKYLKKSLFDEEELGLYWTFQKRFFTHSQSFKPLTAKSLYEGPALAFIGAANSDMISVIIMRRSRHLWSQIRHADYVASLGPPSF